MRLLVSFASVALALSPGACAKSSKFSSDGGWDAAALPDARTRDAGVGYADAGQDPFDAGVFGGDASFDAFVEEDQGVCPADFAELPDCQELSPTSPSVDRRTGVLLRASELGADVRFRSLGGNALLAERGAADAAQPFVVRLDPDETSAQRPVATQVMEVAYAPSGPPVELRSVWGAQGRNSAFDVDVFALACDAQVGCTVLGADSRGDASLAILFDDLHALDDPSPQGVWADYEQVCVYGAGVRCHDGTQVVQRVPDDPSRLLRAMASGGGHTLVVGDGGRMLIDEGYGWEELYSATEDLALADIRNGFFFAGSGSSFVQRDETGYWNQCDFLNPVLLAVDLRGGPYGTFASASGQIVRRTLDMRVNAPGHCAHADLADSLISGTTAPCGAARNPMVISESTLWSIESTQMQCIYL